MQGAKSSGQAGEGSALGQGQPQVSGVPPGQPAASPGATSVPRCPCGQAGIPAPHSHASRCSTPVGCGGGGRGPLRTRQQLSCPPCHCPCTVPAVTPGQHMAVTPEETAAGTRGAGGRQTLARHSHPQGECTATGWGSPWHRPAGPRRAITPPAPWGRHPGIPGPHPVGLPRPPPGMPRPSRHRHPAAVPGEVVCVWGGGVP